MVRGFAWHGRAAKGLDTVRGFAWGVARMRGMARGFARHGRAVRVCSMARGLYDMATGVHVFEACGRP